MRLTILHLSDLHYLPDWSEGNDLILSELIKDLSVQIKGRYSPLLVFSGDFVKRGAKQAHYQEVSTRLDAALTSLGLPKDVRVAVPGNHDVSQEAVKATLVIQKGTLNEIRSEVEFNDALGYISNSFLESKFSHYKDFEQSFARYTCCSGKIGGQGWTLSGEIGLYCLNTALCSFGGAKDSNGESLNDRAKLMIDTRSLYQWISEQKTQFNILVMHHPTDWLSEWSRAELDKIIDQHFSLVLCGHIHSANPICHSRGKSQVITAVAPPLFTKKSEMLGYALITVDTETKDFEMSYRQWAQTNNFVSGTSLAGTDSGRVSFSRGDSARPARTLPDQNQVPNDTLALLEKEFRDCALLYSSKPHLWVDRDISTSPETREPSDGDRMVTQSEMIENLSSCIIRAPAQYGLTCLAKRIALEYYAKHSGARAAVVIDAEKTPDHAAGIADYLERRCTELRVTKLQMAAVVVDHWQPTRKARRMLNNLVSSNPSLTVVVLHNVDDCSRISDTFSGEDGDISDKLPSRYLHALSRNRIRQLVAKYIDGHSGLDEDVVTKRVISDIDTLNIPRIPLNCLHLLKLAEQAFDDSPVNRTEVISRVLSLLFFQFDKIPTYATRPDIRDCEYALGYFSEWLMRERKAIFTKKEFYAKVGEYCDRQLIELDVDVLFAFMLGENVFVRRGDEFAFRFTYWLYYFAAHRMHHDLNFASFMLGEKRYSAYPELLEFYTGIDRRRTDAIAQVTRDLRSMDSEFLVRTGIHADFNPLSEIKWQLTQESAEALDKEIKQEIASSSAPASVKDAVADNGYKKAAPYNQELAAFIQNSSLEQMIQAMRGACRALRNSDHVSPESKAELLKEVMTCWKRVCQILAVLSPLLAKSRSATFEGIYFYLDKSFDPLENAEHRWHVLIRSLVGNVVDWYQEDIFSKKMAPLFINHIRGESGKLDEVMLLLLLVKMRPPAWEKEVERFIVKESKNSFHLSRVFNALLSEFKFGITTERSRHDLRRMAAMAIAKHQTGAKHPDTRLTERAAEQIIDDSKDGGRAPGKRGRSEFFR